MGCVLLCPHTTRLNCLERLLPLRFFADWPGAGGLDVYNRWIPLLEAALGSVSPAPTQDNIDAFFAGNARKAYRLAAQRL